MLEGLPAGATLYNDDMPKRPKGLPSFVPEDQMAQLESDAALARLPDASTRHLVIVLIETGLRAGDACRLRVDCVVADSVGWPCLRFFNTKVAAEQLIPLSAKAAAAISAQQDDVTRCWPTSPWLFPAPKANPDGGRPFEYATLRGRLGRWQETIGLHDSTVREAFDAYCQARVNIHGDRLGYDPVAPTAEAEWVKHHLGRIQASLPNGYCGRPPQQDCPHPNACLTCADFQTTVEFLPTHRHQADETTKLIAAAETDGHHRLADNHRQVLVHLQRIIPALEALGLGDAKDDHGQS